MFVTIFIEGGWLVFRFAALLLALCVCVRNRRSRVLYILYLELLLVLLVLLIFLIGISIVNVHFLRYIFVILGLARMEIVMGRTILIVCFKQLGTLNLQVYVDGKF